MPTGDSLAVLGLLFSLGITAALAAYQMTGTKQRNLAIVSVAFFVAALAWLIFPARLDASRAFQWLLIALPVVTVAVVAMLLRDRGSVLEAEPKTDSRNWRKNMITTGRDLAVRYTNDPRRKNFRHYLEGHSLYPHLRRHLSEEYREKLNARNTFYAMAPGAKWEPLVEWFLDELDRLENEWGLR